MVRGSISLALALALVSCAEEPLEPAALGQVCGSDGPFRLVELEPDQRLRGGLRPFEGRYVYTTARLRGPGEFDLVDAVTWSIGTCGESPRRLADDLEFVRVDPRWPDVLLACSTTTDETVTIDPAGVSPPRVAFPGVGCYWRQNSRGFLDRSGVWLARLPEIE